MVFPKKSEILQKALAKDLERQFRAGINPITPEESELKESGMFEAARTDLMRSNPAFSEQEKYLHDMAGEMGLQVIPIKGLSELTRLSGWKWTDGWSHEHKPERVRKPFMPKPRHMAKIKHHHRKRHVSHNGRTRTMRALRHVRGKKSFSFPDSIWKVRKK
jgi:hypothetical protein